MTTEPDAPDYAFYGEGMKANGSAGLALPIRRALRRLQRPWFLRQVEILHELRQAISAQEAQIGDLRREIAELRAGLDAQETRFLDQTAIAHRLASLEDAAPGP